MIETVMERDFDHFVRDVEPSLRRALTGHMRLQDVPDALSEAFGYAWAQWETVRHMENPTGFLFRVAQSRSRQRRVAIPPAPEAHGLPDVEPQLVPALRALAPMQRSVVWLVHGCGWSYREAATALNISPSAVGTHLSRAMAHLRTAMGVERRD